jgi:hypothetical protein
VRNASKRGSKSLLKYRFVLEKRQRDTTESTAFSLVNIVCSRAAPAAAIREISKIPYNARVSFEEVMECTLAKSVHSETMCSPIGMTADE